METVTRQQRSMQRRSRVPATVIVVSDDREQREQLTALLEKNGLDAPGFTSAEKALASTASGPAPALIVTDLSMPGIDGWQFSRLVRSPEYADLNQVPVLVVSATPAAEETKRIATALGVYAFTAYPFDGDAFIRQVLEILRGQLAPSPPRALLIVQGRHQAGLLSTAFADEGYVADTAQTPQEAIDAAAAASHDVAIIDGSLAEGAADMLLEHLRAKNPQCACIMVTEDTTPGLFSGWMGKGAAACVRKPCEPSYLLKLCGQARKERALMRVEQQHAANCRELRDCQNMFRALTVSEQDAIIMMDTAGVITFWNPAAVRIFGYEPQEATGRDLHELLASPDQYAAYREAFPNFQKNGIGKAAGNTLEMLARCRDGREIPVEISLSAIELSDGWHAVGILRDIASRKQAEQALRASEANLSSILNSIDAAVMSYSIKNSCFLYLSPSTEKIYGRTLDECIRNKFAVVDCVHPDDFDILHDITTRMTSEGSAEGECRILRPDGTAVWVHVLVKLFRDENGEPERIDRMLTDITERKSLELQLRQNQQQTASILNEIDDIVMSSEIDKGTYAYISPSYTKLFGGPLEQHMQNVHLWADSIHPDDAELVYEHIIELTEHGYSERECRIIKPDGEIAWIRLRSKIIQDEHGAPFRIQRILTDITKHKKAEQEREKLQKRLLQAQKMESVARLAGGVAHDFNNMLSIIIGHSDIALGRLHPGQSLHTTFTQIRRAAERSAALTRQLLAFAGRQTIAPQILDLNQEIDAMQDELRQILGSRAQLVWQPGTGLDPVRMDPHQIDQILEELCQNARNAIKTAGTVTISTGRASISKSDCLQQPTLRPGDFVTITVSDDGRGMDSQTLANIFEPFAGTDTPGNDPGLGLATVYGIIEQNKGCISITSDPGSGTRITVYLPRCTDTSKANRETADEDETADRPAGTILLVEDEPDNLELYRAMLEGQGCTVLAANTVRECVRLARSHEGPIDLLITDVVMPDTNGRELANEVLKVCPNIQCLFMSGYSADVIAQHGILDPGINFIEKPFSLQDFTARVQELLNPEMSHLKLVKNSKAKV